METSNSEYIRYEFNIDALDEEFPTQFGSSLFWEELGRTVGTFGFLEDVLMKAIFVISGTTRYSQDEIDSAYQKWGDVMEKNLSAQLRVLIKRYIKALEENQGVELQDIPEFNNDLVNIVDYRNLVCHAFWMPTAETEAFKPIYHDSKRGSFDGTLSIDELKEIRKAARILIVNVMNSVTRLGYNFPGYNEGPGKPI